jgi:hypothetical protein
VLYPWEDYPLAVVIPGTTKGPRQASFFFRGEYPRPDVEDEPNHGSQPCVEEKTDPWKHKLSHTVIERMFHKRVRSAGNEPSAWDVRQDQEG